MACNVGVSQFVTRLFRYIPARKIVGSGRDVRPVEFRTAKGGKRALPIVATVRTGEIVREIKFYWISLQIFHRQQSWQVSDEADALEVRHLHLEPRRVELRPCHNWLMTFQETNEACRLFLRTNGASVAILASAKHRIWPRGNVERSEQLGQGSVVRFGGLHRHNGCPSFVPFITGSRCSEV